MSGMQFFSTPINTHLGQFVLSTKFDVLQVEMHDHETGEKNSVSFSVTELADTATLEPTKNWYVCYNCNIRKLGEKIDDVINEKKKTTTTTTLTCLHTQKKKNIKRLSNGCKAFSLTFHRYALIRGLNEDNRLGVIGLGFTAHSIVTVVSELPKPVTLGLYFFSVFGIISKYIQKKQFRLRHMSGF